MSWRSISKVIYSCPSCFCNQFDLLERNFCTRYPFVSIFFGFKKYQFLPFWHIFSTYWNFFSASVAKFIWEKFFLLLLLVIEIAMIFVDFFFGSNNKILGSFGTFITQYWLFYLKDLPNQFETNLSTFFMFLCSMCPTVGQILRSPSFSLTFLLVQRVTF